MTLFSFIKKLCDYAWLVMIFSFYSITFQPTGNVITNIITGIFISLVVVLIILEGKKIKISITIFFYSCFMVLSLMSVFYSIDYYSTLTRAITIVQVFILMVACYWYFISLRNIEFVLKSIVYAGVFGSSILLIQQDPFGGYRLGTIIGDPNTVGIILSYSFLVSIYLSIFNKKKVFFLLASIILFSVFLTGSRSSIVVIISGLLTLTVLKSIHNPIKSKVTPFIFLFLVVSLGYNLIFEFDFLYDILGRRITGLIERYMFGSSSEESSSYYRTLMIIKGFDFFQNNPILGYGLETYRTLFLQESGIFSYSHNNYIELLVSLGLIGTIIYYLMYGSIFLYALKITKLKDNYVTLVIVLIISMLVAHVFLVFYYVKHEVLFLSLMSAILYKINKESWIRNEKIKDSTHCS